MLLFPAALAAEPEDAFVCPVMAAPADGIRYADPGEISEALYDTLEGWVLAQYEAGCPTAACAHEQGCTYADDCYTSAGAHLVVDYAWNQLVEGAGYDTHTQAWEVQVEAADGTSLSLSYASEYRHTWDPGYSSEVRTWTASWEGAVDAALPETGNVAVEWEWSEYYDDNGHQGSGDAELLDSGPCSWDIVRGGSGYAAWAEWEAYRTIAVGGQALSVGPGYADLCEAARAREATLDGVAYVVDFDTWETVVDADGDSVPANLDCDDSDPEFRPCTEDVACDGVDVDCDGADDADGDGDGYTPECAGGDDCDDASYYVHPGGNDPSGDGVDGDCDGLDGADAATDPADELEAPRGCGGGGAAWLLALPVFGRARRRPS